MKAKQFLFCLLTLLFTVSVPRAVADEDQPRFMIPSADFSDPDKDSERGYAAITTDNPFFTIYMWMFNDYKDDTYWAVKPTLKIDGNELELKGFTDGTYDWTCTVNGVVKYYVHSHANSILVDDSKLFQQQFPEASKKSHGGRDRYMGLDIYIYDNQPGQKHTITARGKVHTDWGAFGEDAWMDVLTLDGKTELSSGETYFNLTDLAATLEWTAPHTLTFTSPSLKDRSWGKYQVVMDNKASSNQQSSGVISVSHDYGSDADYLRDSNIPIEYRYTGKYNNHEMIFHQTKQEKPTTLPYVKSLMASAFDTWKKTVTLKWQMENITTKNNDGTVYLRRGNEVIYSESLSATGQYTDNISYDTPYDYSLTFVPTGWPSETIERQLTYHTVVSLERDFSITDLKVGVSGQGYRVSWTGSSYRSSEKSYYRVYRKVVTASDEAITFADTDLLTSIEATTNTSYSYQDNDVNTTDTYAYMVTVHAQEKDYQTAPVQPSDRLDGSKITSFDATRGTYTNRVELKWTADVKGNDHMVYVIKRHTIDDSGNEQYAANNAYVVLDTLKDDATTRHTTYTDTKMLCGYYYMYKIEGLVNGSKTSFTSQLSDGFARSTATVTGNVTYSSAGRTIGVEGVRMNFEAEGSELQQRSLRCSADSSGLVWQQDNVVLSNYFNQHPFSLQMYVRPDGEQGSNPCLMEMRGILRLGLCDKTADGYLVAATVGDKTYKSTHRLHPEMFNHLTFAYDGKSCAQLMIVDSTNVVMTDTLFTGITLYWQPTPGYEGRVTVFTDADKRNTVRGYVDEVRFFKRQLSVADVQQNFDRLMGGSEVGLIAYWPLDESISTIFRAYDYSSTDGKANENHALIPGGTRTSAIVPGDQLSLHAITDTLGYYALQGLSFAGDGTTYHITPTKGTHDFEPDSRNIYVSQESLSFQPQNFTDNSSFNVKGKVYYENTLYPVKGCTFKVDGVQVKDKYGQLIATDENGEYTIPVSIGLHVIQIEKEGHVFLNDGLWPASGYANINDSISGLTFTDVTKAIVAGRIVGGSVEQGKPLALGQSKANVGAATLTLLTSADVKDAKKMNVLYDTEEGIYNDNPNTLELTAANPDLVHCTASVGGATGLEADANVKTITIHTSPETGEFAVLLPPVPYYVTTIVDHNDEATTALNKYGAQLLDASNVLRTDTATCDVLLPDSTTQHLRFVYNVAFQPSYNAVPIISVRQTDNEFGAFGDSTVVAEEYKDTVRAYHIDTNTNSLVYDYGYPIFTKATTYEFEIASFERYLNYDADPLHPVAYDQPSSAGFLSIRNPMALVGDTIDKVLLDDDGKYIYKFQALEPNVVEPFTQAISICLSIGDNVTPWYWNYSDSEQSLQGYVFSAKLTGSAFFTKAPDELINILRDPFGSSSSMSWSSGSTIHFSHTRDITYNAAVDSGRDVATTVGGKAATGAPGLYAFQGFTIDGDRTRGFAWSISLNHDKTVSHSFTTSKDYSTSSGKIFDGPSGDVFIGISSSLTYGDGREVRLLKGPDKDYYVGTQDVLVTGDSITGMFVYSQYQIENVMIPLLKDKRRSRLTVVNPSALADYRTNFTNPTDSVIYMTSLSPDDPRFGSHNADSQVWGNDTLLTWRTDSMCYWGNSYTVFLPKSYKSSEEEWDCIAEITSQIENWQNKLRDNEQAKVNALTARRKYYKDSYAFDAGSGAVTYSKTTSRTRDYSGSFKYNLARYRKYKLTSTTETASNGSKRSGAFEWKIDTDRNHKIAGGRSNSNTYTMTLLDEVRDNYHSVERYDAPDDFSWIYKQTGGVSSQNYEPEVLTKYYQPGTKISEATVQLEVPHIYCAETVKTNVSADDGADFYLELCNATQAKVTGYINFALQVANDKWATKANVTMNGQPVPDNIFGVYLAPYDTAHVRLNVKPADKSVIHIDSLLVSFYSDGQWTISDDIYLTAHFQPQAEKIKLMASRTVVNTATDTTLVLTASDFNINSSILNAVRLQQRKAGTPDWTTIHSWVKGTPHGDTESALTTPIDTLIDMHNSIAYPDGTYEFRAVTDCTVVGEQILGESPLVTVIKDVTLPQPMALPEPTDGVLGVGDEISVTFNEDIYSQSLSKDANFIIQSVLNTDSIAHEVALRLDGTATPAATSQTGLALGNSSFTVCTWLKYSGTAGTILRHGDGRNAFRINLEEDGHLTVYVTDKNGNAQPYTSINTIPQDLWVYLGLSYDVDAGTLTAHYASGDNEEVLMTGVNVGTSATSQGKIYLGENLTGAMHELSIYSTALTWTTIQSQMYTGKSNTTPSLIGYWHLDEGHGTKSEDLARSRHIQIASPNAWYMENENIALQLDGTNYAAIPFGNFAAASGDSYLLEMWTKCTDTTQGQLFSLDRGKKLDLNIVDGKLQLVADSVAYNSPLAALTPNEWHHVALNVLRGTSSQANLIVDGTSTLTVSTDKVPALAGARLYLGHNMKGAIDEVRLWHSTNTQAAIAERMYYRMDGKNTSDLVAYYPMERTYYDEYNQRIYDFSPINQAAEATDATTIVAVPDGATFASTTETMGLKSAPHKSNLDFHFVADERTVSITLDHSPAALEGCTVSTTLRSYYDMNTNVGAPITWTFDVKQNPLLWDNADVNENIGVGQQGKFTATLTNTGTKDQRWSMVDLPSWLKASPSSGTVLAHGTQDITFTVASGNPIGKYFTTVSARTDRNLDTPLDICLTVEGERPNWKVESYPESMTVTGQICIDGVTSTDTEDMVGAFIYDNGQMRCVGKAQPKYNTSRDAYYVTMLVNGREEMEGSLVSFRLYDASTGKTYPLVSTSPAVFFTIDAVAGTTSQPVVWKNEDKLLQTEHLGDGWTSISLYLKPDTDDQHLFDILGDHIEQLKVDKNTTLTHADGQWSASYSSIKPGQMMKVYLNTADTLYVIGDEVNPEDWPQTIAPLTSTWIGVPTQAAMTIDEAFAGIPLEEGDQVKSDDAVSIYDGSSWCGNLTSILPGRGYIFTSMFESSRTLVFPATSQSGVTPYHTARQGIRSTYKYAQNMVALCSVHDEFETIKDATIEVFDQYGELRGRSVAQLRDTLHVVFISGEQEGEPLIVMARLTDGRTFLRLLPQGFRYDGRVGKLRAPLVIGTQGNGVVSPTLANGTMAVYTTSGVLVYQGAVADFDRKRYTTSEPLIVVQTAPDGSFKAYKLK